MRSPQLSIAVALGLLVLASASASAQVLRTVEAGPGPGYGWLVGCDNLRSCTAVALLEEPRGPPWSYLKLSRNGGRTSEPELKIVLGMEAAPPHGRLVLTLDGAPFAGLLFSAKKAKNGLELRLTSKATFLVLSALKKAKTLSVALDGRTDTKASISVAGTVDALRWIDEAQGRVDTTTALELRDDKPAAAVPAVPSTPIVIVAKPYQDKSPRAIVPAVVKKALENSDIRSKPIVARLSSTTVLAGMAEAGGDHNISYRFHLVQGNEAKSVSFEAPEIEGETRLDPDAARFRALGVLTGAAFNPATNTLSASFVGRGAGDCGTKHEWAWDGHTFRLINVRVMSACRGVPPEDWPVLYQARRG